MTIKDHIIIARAIKSTPLSKSDRMLLVDHFITELSQDNDKFSVVKFAIGCGLITRKTINDMKSLVNG